MWLSWDNIDDIGDEPCGLKMFDNKLLYQLKSNLYETDLLSCSASINNTLSCVEKFAFDNILVNRECHISVKLFYINRSPFFNKKKPMIYCTDQKETRGRKPNTTEAALVSTKGEKRMFTFEGDFLVF